MDNTNKIENDKFQRDALDFAGKGTNGMARVLRMIENDGILDSVSLADRLRIAALLRDAQENATRAYYLMMASRAFSDTFRKDCVDRAYRDENRNKPWTEEATG